MHGGVDNRPGAGGKIGTTAVMRAPKDGYTIGLAVPATLSVLPLTDPGLGRSAGRRDPDHAGHETYLILSWSPSVPARTLKEFIAYARANPDKLNFGTPGNATSYHFHLARLTTRPTSTRVTSRTRAKRRRWLVDLLAGRLQYMMVAGGAEQYLDAGKLHAIATTGPRRWDVLPNVPTVSEAGLPGYVASGWLGYIGPAGLPPEVTERLNSAFKQALNAPDLKNLLASQGYQVRGSSSREFATAIKIDLDGFGKLVRSGKIKLDN